MAEIHLLEELCSKTHDILQVATQNLPIPAKEKARDVRKIISVFTYSLIKELSRDVDVHEDDIYLRYLMGGGLSAEQGRNIVNRTRDEFTKREFSEKCLQAGKQAVSKWLAGDRNIQSVLRDMLHNF